MKTKLNRRRQSPRPAFVPPPLTPEQIATILGEVLAPKPSAPPPPPPAAPRTAAREGPILWTFSHTHPQLKNAILHCCVEAPTIQEARGKAYLIAEQFAENVIGFIRAGSPPNLPQAG